ncbi:MAG: flagellar biosynthetic protein FliO [Lachnospiraceae bacterium]|nr:flagellar biosynthetic protein FliO [Lachnospiraceae bacterium]
MPDGSVLQLVTVLLLLCFVVALSYFATRWLAGYQKLKGANLNIEVIESLRVAPGKFVVIVRIGEEYHALGIGKDEMSYLTKVDAESLTIRAPGETGASVFPEILSRLKAERKHRD